MPRYIRFPASGATYFFTIVTEGRVPVLCSNHVRHALRESVLEVCAARPFVIVAWVLLPDHLHCIWELPPQDGAFSARWSAIKRLTTQRLGLTDASSASRTKRREGRLWQRRFWEHTIRDEGDLRRHIDYVHWNPVKHGLVARASDWPFSTFHRFVRRGAYPASWGGGLAGRVGASAGE